MKIREQNNGQDDLGIPPIIKAGEQQSVINYLVSNEIVVNNPSQEDTHMKGNKTIMEGSRRSTRSRRYAIFDDYIVYLEKIEVGIKMDKEKTFIEAIESDDYEK